VRGDPSLVRSSGRPGDVCAHASPCRYGIFREAAPESPWWRSDCRASLSPPGPSVPVTSWSRISLTWAGVVVLVPVLVTRSSRVVGHRSVWTPPISGVGRGRGRGRHRDGAVQDGTRDLVLDGRLAILVQEGQVRVRSGPPVDGRADRSSRDPSAPGPPGCFCCNLDTMRTEDVGLLPCCWTSTTRPGSCRAHARHHLSSSVSR